LLQPVALRYGRDMCGLFTQLGLSQPWQGWKFLHALGCLQKHLPGDLGWWLELRGAAECKCPLHPDAARSGPLSVAAAAPLRPWFRGWYGVTESRPTTLCINHDVKRSLSAVAVLGVAGSGGVMWP